MGMTLAMRMIQCRRDKGLSQAKLSDLCGIGLDWFSKIEMGVTQGLRDSEVEILSKVFEVEKNYLVIENDGQRGPGDAAPVALLDAEAINRRPSANAPAAPKKEPPSIAKDRLIKDYQAHIKELEFVIDHLEQDKKKLKEIIIALAIKQLVQGEEGWKNVLRDLI